MTIEFDPIDYEIKPALFIFDNWQTHDLLSIAHTQFDTTNFLTNGCNIIDRYVPNEVPWCDEWSVKAFDFAKRISVVPTAFPNGKDWYEGVTTGFWNKTLVREEGLQNYIAVETSTLELVMPETMDIIIEPNKVLTLSWLVVSKEVALPNDSPGDILYQHSFYAGALSKVRVFERKYKTVINGTDEPLEYEFKIPLNMANFSLVLTNGEPKEPDDDNDFLYEKMVERLDEWVELLNIDQTVIGAVEFGLFNPLIQTDSDGILRSVSYGSLSPNLYYAGLIFANNNPWGEVLELTDLGYPPVLKPSDLEDIILPKPLPYLIDINKDLEIAFAVGAITSVFTYKDGATLYPHNIQVETIYLGNTSTPTLDVYKVNFTFLQNFYPQTETITFEEIVEFLEGLPTYLEELILVDSVRIKEIHAALQADKFAVDDNDEDVARVANLGYYIERISRVLGISVNSDGSIRSIRQRKVIDPDTTSVPAGWGLGQWALNKGGNSEGQEGGLETEERDGIVYNNRCNRAVKSSFNDADFELGSPTSVLCENVWQYLESYLEDLDQGLNWQEMGAMALPSPNPSDDGTNRYCTFEGMGTLLAEVAYMLSSISKDTSQTYISSIVTQAMGKAILQAFGTPIGVGYQEYVINDGESDYSAVIPIPIIEDDSPTLVQLLFNVIENQARILGANTVLKEPKQNNLPPNEA